MRSNYIRCAPLAALVAFILVLAGCRTEPRAEQGNEMPELETRADSVAMKLYEAYGGSEAWAAVPYLRFNFAVEQEGQQRVVARHLWDRQTGAYRLEWSASPDSNYVALFNVGAFGTTGSDSVEAGEEAQVYLNGTALDAAANAQMMKRAHQRFINDMYWLLAPVKVFDPGVNRSYVADSSNADVAVLHLTFGNVGLTPGDQYWLYVNRETGRLDRWAYHLQGMSEDEPPRMFRWTGYETYETPAGPIHLATRKEMVGGPVAILTNALDVPSSVPEAMFSDPEPRL